MRSRVSSVAGVVAATFTVGSLFLASSLTSAQTRPAEVMPPLSAGTAAVSVSGTGVAAPPTIVLNDPLLAPVPPAEKILSTWKDALQNINARSVDLAMAVQDVEKAEGNWRLALASALPTLSATGQVTQQLIWNPSPVLVAAGAAHNPTASGVIQASVPVIASSAWLQTKQASVQVTSAKLSLEDKKRTVFAGVANAIVAVFTAERIA
jgi:outer membrane protein TolC